MMTLKEKYSKEIIPAMMAKFGFKNPMAVPKVKKVVINTSFGKMFAGKTGEDLKKSTESVLNDISLIAGQKPVATQAKKSVAGFKLRQGMVVGAKVTLRGGKMYDFISKIANVDLPRTRDFRGLSSKSFDKKGNLTIPMREHIVFPEISPEKSKVNFGLEVTIITTAKTIEEGAELLRMMGLPIKANEK